MPNPLASADNIRVGTASWTDPTLIKSHRFYPPEARTPEDRLRFYATQFDMVEIDTSYYALPATDTATAWVERTPPAFTFDIKAFRVFTLHQTPLKSFPSDLRDDLTSLANDKGNVYYPELPQATRDELWSRFEDALRPLRDVGKLGYVLLQFPPWVTKRRSNIEHIQHCAQRLDGYRVAVEFRSATWMQEGDRRETLARLREENLAMVIVDEPQGFSSSIPTVWEVTSPDLAVVRFHGRNREMWTKKNLKSSAERFDYLYSSEELQSFVEPVRSLRSEAREVHAVFNNCMEDKAQRNARAFREMLTT